MNEIYKCIFDCLFGSVASPAFPSYLASSYNDKQPSVTGRTPPAAGAGPPVCLVQSKTRAKAKCEGQQGGSKIFERYQDLVTERTQYPYRQGNLQRRIRRTKSHGSIKAILEQDSKYSKVYYPHLPVTIVNASLFTRRC